MMDKKNRTFCKMVLDTSIGCLLLWVFLLISVLACHMKVCSRIEELNNISYCVNGVFSTYIVSGAQEYKIIHWDLLFYIMLSILTIIMSWKANVQHKRETSTKTDEEKSKASFCKEVISCNNLCMALLAALLTFVRYYNTKLFDMLEEWHYVSSCTYGIFYTRITYAAQEYKTFHWYLCFFAFILIELFQIYRKAKVQHETQAAQEGAKTIQLQFE